MNTIEKLAPCPFCGSTGAQFERIGTPRQSCIVACNNCGARHESSDEGLACGSSWNDRAQQAGGVPSGFSAIQWELNGDKHCGYNNWLGITPFGRILITWKGWKEYHDACIDEFPGDLPAFVGDPAYVKEAAEQEFYRRLSLAAPSPSAVQEEIEMLRAQLTNARERIERSHQILMGIYTLLDPMCVQADGKTWVFKNPDAQEVLRLLSERIRAVPDQIAAPKEPT